MHEKWESQIKLSLNNCVTYYSKVEKTNLHNISICALQH